MADATAPAAPAAGATHVPRIRDQLAQGASAFANYIHATVKDPAAREALIADVKKHVEEMAAITKDHMTDAEKRQALMDQAKVLSTQASTAAKDPHQRAKLLDKLKATAATLQEVVTDPAKRQEVHDQLAATTHKLLQAAQAPAPAGAPAAAAAPAAAPAATQ